MVFLGGGLFQRGIPVSAPETLRNRFRKIIHDARSIREKTSPSPPAIATQLNEPTRKWDFSQAFLQSDDLPARLHAVHHIFPSISLWQLRSLLGDGMG
jgi:hypothetical protein